MFLFFGKKDFNIYAIATENNAPILSENGLYLVIENDY